MSPESYFCRQPQSRVCALNLEMARPRNGRYEKSTSRHERETSYDQPRSERGRHNDRSYDRQDDSIRHGDHQGPNGRAQQESGRQGPRRESSSRGSRDEVFVVYEEPKFSGLWELQAIWERSRLCSTKIHCQW